jgi:cyclohexanecarboxylate-CoA ligase
MKLRATYRPPNAKSYAAPGGAWDLHSLDEIMKQRPASAGASVVDGDLRLTGDELETRIASLAGSLRRLGVRRGDVVAWQLPNWWEALVLYRACWRCGAVAAPLHHQFGSSEVEHMIDLLEPKVSFSTPALPLADRDGAILVRTTESPFATMLSGAPVTESPNRAADLAVVLFTSGSTGRPKAVLHTHRGLGYKSRAMSRVHDLSTSDAVLMPSPLAHISGLMNAVLLPGVTAMRSVLMERWDVERGLHLIEAEDVSYMIGPPSIFTAMMETSTFSPTRVSSMRVISSGMMGITPAFVESARDGFGAVVKRSYGSTEAPTVSTCLNTDPEEQCRDTDGRAVGDAEVRIANHVTGEWRPADIEGEVWTKGPELFAGYSDAAETAAALHGGWFRTGDLGVMDADGWLRITGRIKDLIIRGGENISSSEVERALESHPGIHQAIVVGRPDERLGERVVAFIVGSHEFDVTECRRWFAEHGVARFKTPEVVVQIDQVPLLAAGKPDRAALRARAATLNVSL